MEQLEVVTVVFEVWLYLRCVLAGPACGAVVPGGGVRQDRDGRCESRFKSFEGFLDLVEGCGKLEGLS